MAPHFVGNSSEAAPPKAAHAWSWWRAPNRLRTDWRGQRVWLIGASSGIGAALATELVGRGARVVLSARSEDALHDVAARALKAASSAAEGETLVVAFDATEPDAWARARQTVTSAWGGVDVLVMCAGAYTPMRAWDIDITTMSHIIDVNLRSVYLGLQSNLSDFRARGNGAVVLVASVAGLVGLPNATVYGPTKAALINLAELLHSDVRAAGIDVYLVNPGFVRTKLTEKNAFVMPALLTPEQAAQAMLAGMAAGQFSIHFPKRFTLWLYALRHLPDRLRLAIVRRFTAAPESDAEVLPTTPPDVKPRHAP